MGGHRNVAGCGAVYREVAPLLFFFPPPHGLNGDSTVGARTIGVMTTTSENWNAAAARACIGRCSTVVSIDGSGRYDRRESGRRLGTQKHTPVRAVPLSPPPSPAFCIDDRRRPGNERCRVFKGAVTPCSSYIFLLMRSSEREKVSSIYMDYNNK